MDRGRRSGPALSGSVHVATGNAPRSDKQAAHESAPAYRQSSGARCDSLSDLAHGKYLAYSDEAGLHIKLLETGETRTLPLPAEVDRPTLPGFRRSGFPTGPGCSPTWKWQANRQAFGFSR